MEHREHLDRLLYEPEGTTAASDLAEWIASSIAPINKHQPDPNDIEGSTEPDPYPQISTYLLPLTEPGLLALHHLFHHFDVKSQPLALSPSTVITLISLTDDTQPYSTPLSTDLASGLLFCHLMGRDRPSFPVDTVLTSYLKPLFSSSRPPTVTPSGRKAAFPDNDSLSREPGLPDDSRRTKPWKYVDLRSIPVLTWAIDASPGGDEESDMPHWPLYIPPLLALLDDPLTRVRASGLRLAAAFLRRFPAPRLRATGLARVFEDAVFPTLSYLPSITPEGESVALLDPGYDALLVLAGRLADRPEPGGEEGGKREERRLLDRMVREGILTGYFHCPEHPGIVEVLMRKTGEVVEALGIGAVKHLKDLVPMLKGVVTDPFASARPAAMREGVKALQKVIEHCWPRLVEGVWSEEVLGIVVLGWVGLLDVDEKGNKGKTDVEVEEDIEEIRQELSKTAAMLAAVVRTGGTDLVEKIRPLVDMEPALAGLFKYEPVVPQPGHGVLVEKREPLVDEEPPGLE